MTKEDRVEVASKSLQHLTNTILTGGVTKKNIKEFADSLVAKSTNKKQAWAMTKIVEELLKQIQASLNGNVIKEVMQTPESQRRIGNIKYDVYTRVTPNYEEDPGYKDINNKLKSKRSEIKKQVDETIKHLKETGEMIKSPVTYKETPYVRVNIPNE